MNRADLVSDDRLQAVFERRADRGEPGDLRATILARTTVTRQRTSSRLRLGGLRPFPILHPAWVVLLILIALVAVAVGAAVVGEHPRTPLRAGSWTDVPSMPVARSEFTATLLVDGRVLVAGGVTDDQIRSGVVSSLPSELYDPIARAWMPTAAMIDARERSTAIRLANGSVLVLGGIDRTTDTALPSAELYDPRSSSWTRAANMAEARSGFTATLLPDGKVLVAGGANAGGVIAAAELFDPATGSWAPTGAMHQARTGSTATLLHDGRVLVAGGTAGSSATLAATELYDPTDGTWTSGPTMVEARRNAAAALLPDGTVLVAGGTHSSGLHSDAMASAEVYDPRTGSWSATGAMNHPDASMSATPLNNGLVLVLGGFENDIGVHVAELYDPASRTWSVAGTGLGTTAHSATLLLNGDVLVAGGSITGSPVAAAQIYDPVGGD